MPTLSSLNSLPPPHLLTSLSAPPRRFLFFGRPHHHLQSRLRLVASAASSHEFNPNSKYPSSGSKKSVLSNLIHEIEPLDVSHIQKDVPADTVDAMKRTISGMLGLLPSEQFNVLIEALWEPLSKLLISSMMTGYTLRNAEYRLCLERNLELHDRHSEKQKPECSNHDGPEVLFDGNTKIFSFTGEKELSPESERTEDLSSDIVDVQGLGEISPEAEEYIHHLYARLSSAKNELRETERKNAALQMQHFVGEEKNDLLDYLRSLQPEKVAELSEPTSPELQEIVQSVVHGLLATLSPKMHSKLPTQSENPKSGTLNIGKDDCTELLENTSLHFQPLISLTRDYLARLLFWCMLLGHYLRGLEYRLQLMQLLTLSGEDRSGTRGGKQSA